MRLPRLLLPLVLLAASVLPVAAQTVLLDVYSNSAIGYTGGTMIVGQSFLTPADGTSDTLVAFKFSYDFGAPAVGGNLYLFSSAFSGPPTGLAAASYLAVGAWNASNGRHEFSAGATTLAPGTAYWVYADTAVERVVYNTDNSYANGALFWSYDNANFGNINPNLDANFTVYANVIAPAAVPEPSTYAALAGAAALGFTWWRRRSAATPAPAAS